MGGRGNGLGMNGGGKLRGKTNGCPSTRAGGALQGGQQSVNQRESTTAQRQPDKRNWPANKDAPGRSHA